MSSTSRAWIAAASIGAVEALKDQLGFCRLNCALRLLQQQHSNTNIRSSCAATRRPHKKLSGQESSASTMVSKKIIREQKMKQSEESLRTVMYLSCWGPN